MIFLIKGLILGFSIAAPVGPIGLLCIRRTLIEGKSVGFISGLGAATADAFYGFIAAFGLTAVSSFLLNYTLPIRVIGGLFLFYLALKIFLSKPNEGEVSTEKPRTLFSSYFSTLLLTLSNPVTILSFVAIFASFGLGLNSQNYESASLVVIGVFLGSALWWIILSLMVGLLKDKLKTKQVWINRISAILIAMLGVLSFIGF